MASEEDVAPVAGVHDRKRPRLTTVEALEVECVDTISLATACGPIANSLTMLARPFASKSSRRGCKLFQCTNADVLFTSAGSG